MKPLAGRIIVKADVTQKETIKHGCLTLTVPFRDKYNEDTRVGNPTLCEVVSSTVPELQEGDFLILQHNSLINPTATIKQDGDIRYVTIEADKHINGKIDRDGNFTPLFGNVVVERIDEEPRSIIITPDAYKKKESNKVRVVSGVGFEPGQQVLIYTYADYEVLYTLNGEEKKVVTVHEEDIVAVEKKDTAEEAAERCFW